MFFMFFYLQIDVFNIYAPYWLQIKCDQFVGPEIRFVTADVTAVFVNNQRGIQRWEQDFDKKFVFEEEHNKKVDRQISWEKLDKAYCS